MTEPVAIETVVVYDSRFGNTERLAQVMLDAIRPTGAVRMINLEALLPEGLGSPDLLLLGGPTQSHGLSARMRQFTDELVVRPGTAISAATFDTRYRLPSAVSGSAARAIARRLKQRGVQLLVEPESFFVSRDHPPVLEPGETERAAAWARQVANRCALSRWCAA